MMVEEHLKHLLPPSLIEEMNPWFDLARRSLSSRTMSGNRLTAYAFVPATAPLIPPAVQIRPRRKRVYEGLLQDKQLECVYQGRGFITAKEKTYILKSLLALVQKGSIIYLVCTRHDKSDIQTFALHRFKSAVVLNSRALHPVNFDIDEYIDSGALGFPVTSTILPKMSRLNSACQSRMRITLRKASSVKTRKIEKMEDGMSLITATVPFTCSTGLVAA